MATFSTGIVKSGGSHGVGPGTDMDQQHKDVTTEWVLDRIRVESDLLLQAIEQMGERATTAFVTEPDGWTAKDVLAHLIHYLGQIAFALGAPEKPPAYVISQTRRLSGSEWNEQAVAFWRSATLDDVRGEFIRLVGQLIAAAGKRTDVEIRADHGLPWAPSGALWEFIGRDTFLYEWPAHRAQIEAAAR